MWLIVAWFVFLDLDTYFSHNIWQQRSEHNAVTPTGNGWYVWITTAAPRCSWKSGDILLNTRFLAEPSHGYETRRQYVTPSLRNSLLGENNTQGWQLPERVFFLCFLNEIIIFFPSTLSPVSLRDLTLATDHSSLTLAVVCKMWKSI